MGWLMNWLSAPFGFSLLSYFGSGSGGSEQEQGNDSGSGFFDSFVNKILIYFAVIFFIYKFLKHRHYV